MPNNRRTIEALAKQLNDETDDLRAALTAHKRAVARFARLVRDGTLGVEALARADAALHREQVVACLDEFEHTRHELRLAIFGLCVDQGEGLSTVGRQLGISRQLASRLAAEASDKGYVG